MLKAPQLKAFVIKQLLTFNQKIFSPLSNFSHESLGSLINSSSNHLGPRVCRCVRNVLFIVQTGYAVFPGKRRQQEARHFGGDAQWADPDTTRLQEVRTFALIYCGVQSIKQALLSLTLQKQSGNSE